MYGLNLSAAVVDLECNNFLNYTTMLRLQAYPTPSTGGFVHKNIISKIQYNGTNSNTDTYAIYLDATGGLKNNYAIYCNNGVTAGLRPYTKVISNSTVLDKIWYNILLLNTTSITLTLPSDPETGQTYEISRVNKYDLTFNGNGKEIFRMDERTIGTTTTCVACIENLRVVYSGERWYILPYTIHI